MQHPKPRVEFSEKFHQFASDLIARCSATENPKLRLPRRHVNALASDYGFLPLTNQNQRALRELMGERGYKIQIGADAVFISRLPVSNVGPEQWPALIENICEKLVSRFTESGESLLRLSPAKFRNLATIWPADNPDFNQHCVDEMAERGYSLIFRVNYVDLWITGTETKPAKRVPKAQRDVQAWQDERLRIIALWAAPAQRPTALDTEQLKKDTAAAFGMLFTHHGRFVSGIDPYYTDYSLEDIGEPGQRGTEAEIHICNFLFDDSGTMREWLQEPLRDLLSWRPTDYGRDSDVMRLYWGTEMSRITRQQYSTVYAWK